MKNALKLILAVCFVSSFSATGNAATVNFAGTVTANNALWAAGTAMSLSVAYSPVAGLVTNITSATLTIGGETWSVGPVANGLTLTQNAGANNDSLSIQIANFGTSLPSGWGSTFSNFSFSIQGGIDAAAITEANVDALRYSGTGSGSFFLFGGLPGGANVNVLLGMTPVPEPGSLALLSCLGLVFGRGALKRRKQAKELAA